MFERVKYFTSLEPSLDPITFSTLLYTGRGGGAGRRRVERR